jgi:acetyl esterase/lipase
MKITTHWPMLMRVKSRLVRRCAALATVHPACRRPSWRVGVRHDLIVHTVRAWPQGEEQVSDRIIGYGANPDQIMEVRDGHDGAARPLVIIIHGGFWRPDIDRVHARPMAEAVAAAGWTVALPEYARVLHDPEPTLADLNLLLARAVKKIPAHNGQVVLIGHSAGGHLVLWAGAARLCPTLIGTLALAPVADLLLAHQLGLGNDAVLRFLGCGPELRPDLDPCRMPVPPAATTLIHGVEDDTVPLAISESYVAAHPLARLLAVVDAGHYAVIDPQAPAWSSVMTELARFSATDPPSQWLRRPPATRC